MLVMRKQNLRQVRPEGFDVERLWAAAREGRLFIDEERKPSNRKEVSRAVLAYVGRIRRFATRDFKASVDSLWEEILCCDIFEEYLLPKSKARKCKDFDKYNLVRIVGVLRNLGVYEWYGDRKMMAQLEMSDKDSSYRSYLGKGIEEFVLRRKLREIVEKNKT